MNEYDIAGSLAYVLAVKFLFVGIKACVLFHGPGLENALCAENIVFCGGPRADRRRLSGIIRGEKVILREDHADNAKRIHETGIRDGFQTGAFFGGKGEPAGRTAGNACSNEQAEKEDGFQQVMLHVSARPGK